MTYYEAINILDERREGADMPQERINIALFLTGDISENEILRVYPYGNTDKQIHNSHTINQKE